MVSLGVLRKLVKSRGLFFISILIVNQVKHKVYIVVMKLLGKIKLSSDGLFSKG
jgi:hypothetical protein